jgi:hypothetical protein
MVRQRCCTAAQFEHDIAATAKPDEGNGRAE